MAGSVMFKPTATLHLTLPLLALLLSGCTGVSEYFHNGCKVGPNFKSAEAPVARKWIDADDKRVHTSNDDLAGWWTVFDDPLLNDIISRAYNQNLTLRMLDELCAALHCNLTDLLEPGKVRLGSRRSHRIRGG